MEAGTEMKTFKAARQEADQAEEEWVYRVNEVLVDDEEVGQHQLYDDAYAEWFFDAVMSEEEWREVIDRVNDIWRPAAYSVRRLDLWMKQGWQNYLICYLPCIMQHEHEVEETLNVKRRELVEYLHQVNSQYQSRGLLFDLREHIDRPQTFIHVYKGKLDA